MPGRRFRRANLHRCLRPGSPARRLDVDTPVINGSGPLDTRRPPNSIELRRVARFFDDLAHQIRGEAVRDAELTGRSPMALSSYWQEAVRLLCQAVEAGAQLEWWPEARKFERYESDSGSPEKSVPAIRIGGFLRFGPNEVLIAAWLRVVTLLLAKYGRYFGRRNLEPYVMPDDKFAKWEGVGKIHAEVHTRACQLLAELLRGEADDGDGGQLATQARGEKLLSIQETAERLNIDRTTLRRHRDAKPPKIPPSIFVTSGGKEKVLESALDAWILKMSKESQKKLSDA